MAVPKCKCGERAFHMTKDGEEVIMVCHTCRRTYTYEEWLHLER